jgi:hypothetical protein
MIIVSTHLEPQPHTPECSVLPQTIARLLSRRSCERASTLSSQRRGWTDAAQTAYGTMRRGAEQRVAVALLCRADAPAAPNHVARTRLRTLAAADERSATASSSSLHSPWRQQHHLQPWKGKFVTGCCGIRVEGETRLRNGREVRSGTCAAHDRQLTPRRCSHSDGDERDSPHRT